MLKGLWSDYNKMVHLKIYGCCAFNFISFVSQLQLLTWNSIVTTVAIMCMSKSPPSAPSVTLNNGAYQKRLIRNVYFMHFCVTSCAFKQDQSHVTYTSSPPMNKMRQMFLILSHFFFFSFITTKVFIWKSHRRNLIAFNFILLLRLWWVVALNCLRYNLSQKCCAN